MGPKGVSVDQNGHVIVVDNKACTVFIFQLTGKLISKFGSRGNGDKQFAGSVRHDTRLNVSDAEMLTEAVVVVAPVLKGRTSLLSTRTTRSL